MLRPARRRHPGGAEALHRGRGRLPAAARLRAGCRCWRRTRRARCSRSASPPTPSTELDGAIAAFRRQRLDQDLAQAELALAQAALAAGALGTARRWAVAARRRFTPPGQRRLRLPGGSHPAARAIRRAAAPPRPHRAGGGRAGRRTARPRAGQRRGPGRAARGPRPDRLPSPGRRRGSGSRPSAARTRPPRSRSACCAGWPGPSWPSLRAGRPRCWPSFAPAWTLVRARRGSAGQHRPADRHRRPSAPTWPPPACGRRSTGDRPPLVFAWLERARAQAFRATPVRPPADPRAAEILAELRQLSYLIRDAELNGTRDPAAIARRAGCSARSGSTAGRPPAAAEARQQGQPWARSARALRGKRADAGQHPRPGRRAARGRARPRGRAPDPPGRLRRGRRGRPAAWPPTWTRWPGGGCRPGWRPSSGSRSATRPRCSRPR